jgi:large conductance mechanosensitive channel
VSTTDQAGIIGAPCSGVFRLTYRRRAVVAIGLLARLPADPPVARAFCRFAWGAGFLGTGTIIALRLGRSVAAPLAATASQRGAMLKEFREFALKGNVVDLAIGVIIGAAFGKIVESLVGDIIMPLIGAIGSVDFSNYFLGLNSTVTAPVLVDAKKQGAVLAYGNFLTIAVNFLIIAFVLFLVVKGVNTLRRREAAKPAEPAAPPQDVALLTEIRDLLKQRA